jgi:hypothetical protein
MTVRTDWIQTYTGRQVFPAEPDPSKVAIEDIAHHLALQCRFAGGVERFYSVAQHSFLVAEVVGLELGLVGLLHDAAEAYVQDFVRPLKRTVLGAAYRELEHGWALAIGEAFGLGAELADLPPEVKLADNVLLATEARDLFATPTPAPWGPLPAPLLDRIESWPWQAAETSFLRRFHELMALGSTFGEEDDGHHEPSDDEKREAQ